MSRGNWSGWLGIVLLVTGAILLAWSGWVRHEASVTQSRAREWLTHRKTTATPAPRTPAVLHRGDVVGELAIPHVHLSVMVLEGDDERILKVAAGHISGTALTPGFGNIGIAAHRDTFFRALRLIHINDLITLKTSTGFACFSVSDVQIVKPSDTQVLSAAPGRDLTLVTCYPFYYVGSAPKRFIVHARLVS
jgi:sortase A